MANLAFRTRDVDRARAEVGRLFCPHRLEPTDGNQVQLTLSSHRIRDIGLIHLDYGTAVSIDPGCLDTFYLVQLPLRGAARVRYGQESIVSTSSVASVLSPHARVAMEWGAGNPQSIVYLSRATVELHAERMLGHRLRGPLEFATGMHMASAAVCAWHRSIEYARNELEQDSPFLADERFGARLEEMIVQHLLVAQPHTYSEAMDRVSAPGSRAVRHAVEILRKHHREALTVSDVAEAVGVSVRSLQEGFRRELDTTPTQYLRRCRLLAARDALAEADPVRDTVTRVALAHGFQHLGRFATDYRRQFGESPSATLAH